MIVGVCTVELLISESRSLKDKRQVLHSLKDWQKAVLGMVCVANEGSHVNQVLEQALNLIRSMPAVEVVRSQLELL
jgi:uncharacterized protein YlxP (DUF503 family)